jgi:hypothetical protein
VLPKGTPHSITGDFDALLLDALRSLDERAADRGDDFSELSDFDDPGLPAPRTRLEVFLERLRKVDGYRAACLVDSETGVVLGSHGHTGELDIHTAAGGYAEVYRSERAALARLDPGERLEDIVLTTHDRFDVLHAVTAQPALFIFVVLDRRPGNLMMARFALAAAEAAHDA